MVKAESEVADRNGYISTRDGYIYGDNLERSLKIPISHDRTPINWLKEQLKSTETSLWAVASKLSALYDSKDLNAGEDEEMKQEAILMNKIAKSNAEQRQILCKSIIEDNGGEVFFQDL